jgi:tRNA-dihydrouridine synthase
VDSFDTYPELAAFVRTVSQGSAVTHFIIHARKCLLKGLNPHQNRTVPPLRYEWVWALKRDFPHLDFSLNGGVLTLEEAAAALRIVNGSDGTGSSGEGGEAAEGEVEAAAAAAGEAVEAAAEAEASSTSGGSDSGSGGQRQGIMGVMVGRAAYNMPWDSLGEVWQPASQPGCLHCIAALLLG